MATAPQKAPVAGRVVHLTDAAPEPAALTFVVFEDNGGDHRWAIVDKSGESLAQSRAFASRDDAQASADAVRDGVGVARAAST